MELTDQTIDRAGESASAHREKPDNIAKISKPGWGYIFERALNSFTSNGCTDLAASLTYFTVLSIFPGLLAVVSLLGVFGRGEETTQAILDFIQPYAPSSLMQLIEGPITQLTTSTGAGLALITGVVGALWTASGYVGGFGRALNRVYGVVEGRPIWKLRPFYLLVTFIMVVIVVIMMLLVLSSGDVLRFFGDFIGLGDTAVMVWNWARWPVLVLFAVVLIALLYYATPNIKQPKIHWLSPGAIFALVFMAVAGAAFGFYVSNFGNYNATYGTLGGVIVMLLLIWIMNNVLLFGAVIDSELERARELQAGIKAEDHLRLPPRDVRQAEKMKDARSNLVEQGRALRLDNDRIDYSEEK
ncbi:YihY/virulence factor BrkB family protein [Rothia sp. AR01]|uniref:YihY/virulence factor BrkB family protein n=1 Tax=Rothia santali TaxID=2949643 RepID=A0A9X2HFB3_9MICC|nr:YihY/virulence factor BrkB family protein [Rothia santali]MCP3426229.1 YihY/virulence factor BrkB family protein [Rothia santali]